MHLLGFSKYSKPQMSGLQVKLSTVFLPMGWKLTQRITRMTRIPTSFSIMLKAVASFQMHPFGLAGLATAEYHFFTMS